MKKKTFFLNVSLCFSFIFFECSVAMFARKNGSVKTEILEKGANSSLLIAKINKSDSGNYSCFINATHEYTVSVHVLNGKYHPRIVIFLIRCFFLLISFFVYFFPLYLCYVYCCLFLTVHGFP